MYQGAIPRFPVWRTRSRTACGGDVSPNVFSIALASCPTPSTACLPSTSPKPRHGPAGLARHRRFVASRRRRGCEPRRRDRVRAGRHDRAPLRPRPCAPRPRARRAADGAGAEGSRRRAPRQGTRRLRLRAVGHAEAAPPHLHRRPAARTGGARRRHRRGRAAPHRQPRPVHAAGRLLLGQARSGHGPADAPPAGAQGARRRSRLRPRPARPGGAGLLRRHRDHPDRPRPAGHRDGQAQRLRSAREDRLGGPRAASACPPASTSP